VIENVSKEEIAFALCDEKIPWKEFFNYETGKCDFPPPQ